MTRCPRPPSPIPGIVLSAAGLLAAAPASFAQEAAAPPPAAAASMPTLPGAEKVKDFLGGLLGGRKEKDAKPPAPPPTSNTLAPGAAPGAGPGGSSATAAAVAATSKGKGPKKHPMDTQTEIAMQASSGKLNELAVDEQCVKPEEDYDVFGKAAAYAGTHAQLRLQRMLESDFAYDDLTEDDKRMLKYLAYTTVWVPAPLETAVGTAWAAFSSGGDDGKTGITGRTQKRALARLADRLAELRSAIGAFPGDATLVFDPGLSDGAFARAGGLVVISARFLSLMDENDNVRDVVLAHELSHLYKRHTIKELQIRLVSSSAGFELVKKLLGKPADTRVPGFGFVKEMFGNAMLAKALVDELRASQATYAVNQELEADACAMQWLGRIELPQREAWQVFSGILSFSGAHADGRASYETQHPSPAKRTLNIELALEKQRSANRQGGPAMGAPGAAGGTPPGKR